MDLKSNEIDDIMREVFGLQGIKDSAVLKEEVQRRMASMNVFERAKIQMRIGTKKQEYEGRILGTKYSPSNPILCLASIFFLVLGSGAGYAIFCTNLSLVIKVIAGILGIYWMLTSWRGFARIIFRISNSRDW